MIVFILIFYFLPALIASARRLSNSGSIFVVNLFLGWTAIGWVVALAWAVSGSAEKEIKKCRKW